MVFYELDDDMETILAREKRRTKNYIIDAFENTPLPRELIEKIACSPRDIRRHEHRLMWRHMHISAELLQLEQSGNSLYEAEKGETTIFGHWTEILEHRIRFWRERLSMLVLP